MTVHMTGQNQPVRLGGSATGSLLGRTANADRAPLGWEGAVTDKSGLRLLQRIAGLR